MSDQPAARVPSPAAAAEAGAEPRAELTLAEIRGVLGRYAVGRVGSLRPLAAGNPRSPKVVVESAAGRLLLKRRDGDAATPGHLELAGAVRRALVSAGVPVPRLAATREGEGHVRVGGWVYELLEFIEAEPFDRSPWRTEQAGRTLAAVHAALAPVAGSAGAAALPVGWTDEAGVERALAALASPSGPRGSSTATGTRATCASAARPSRP